MKAQEKINKAKVKILQKSPFFSYLSLFLKFHENNEITNSIGVSADGDVVYNTEFIESISDEELLGVFAHEILHLALLHLTRVGSRDREKWNIATDLCVNSMLLKEDFVLPKNGLIPDTYNNNYDILGKTISDISKKTAEEIYGELPEIPRVEITISGSGEGEGKDTDGNGHKGFDDHNFDGDKDGKGIDESKKNDLENEWLNRINEAYIHSQQRGHTPYGIERYIDKLKKASINWRTLLNKYLVSQIPYDFTWLKRSKKSRAIGSYLPDTIKEKIEVVVMIDTSGSIGREELTEFVSEIIGLAKAYNTQIDMRMITHDTEPHTDLMIENGNIKKIKEMEMKGGGGTSHKPTFEYIKEKYPQTKCVIAFTDGDSDLDEFDLDEFDYNKIIVLNKTGNDYQLKKAKGRFIPIKIKNE